MPKNFSISFLKKGETEDLRFESLEAAKTALMKGLEEVELSFKNNPSFTAFNPTFGRNLNRYEWRLYCQKHFQHHFEQFGLI